MIPKSLQHQYQKEKVILTAKYMHLHTVRRIFSISISVLSWVANACFTHQENPLARRHMKEHQGGLGTKERKEG
jgi:hypothetical protein